MVTNHVKKQPGDFCWVDIATPDIKNTQTFYQTILNWTSNEHPMPQGGDYTMFTANGAEIAGGYEITPEMASEGVQPHWGSYVLVENADELTLKAKTLGATVLREPFDVSDMGRMAVLSDPTGAVFYLWQPTQTSEAKPTDNTQPGNLGWNELLTTDTKKAEAFYKTLFGWESQTQEMEAGKVYTSFINHGTPIAGMTELTDKWADANPHWGVYFSVKNLDEVLKKAQENSATVLYEPISHPDVGRFTMIRDPQGIHCSLIQFK